MSAEMNENCFLSVRNIVVEYTSGNQAVHAVNGISFDLEKGKTLGLVGETGAGKTTIAKTIMRILPEPPAKIKGGQIFFEGRDILSIDEKEMRKLRGKKISMVFQDPMTALNPVKRVVDQIAEVIAQHSDVSMKEAKKSAVEMLKRVNIPEERAREYPHQFSGGMKQRVVIAIALACNPDLLLADEPTTALDVTIQAQVLEMIKLLKKDNGTSMILITHDLGVVAENCDNVAVIYAGEIVEYGTKFDIFLHTAHPYTQGLFASIPDLESDVSRLHTIYGLPPDPTDLPAGCSFMPRCPHATEACRQAEIPMREVSPGHFCRCIIDNTEA